jgi:DNA-binding FrmR family transcriptional regulator
MRAIRSASYRAPLLYLATMATSAADCAACRAAVAPPPGAGTRAASWARKASTVSARTVVRLTIVRLPRLPSSAYSGTVRGYTQDKDAYLKRLRRIEGQVRGLQRMVESDTYCIDILTQVSAVTRALQAVALGLVEDHLGHCVAQAIEDGGPEAQDKVKEASKAIARLVRS